MAPYKIEHQIHALLKQATSKQAADHEFKLFFTWYTSNKRDGRRIVCNIFVIGLLRDLAAEHTGQIY